MVAAAVCDRGAVGIDLEWHKPQRDHRSIARLTFGPEEQGTAERGGIRSFYRLWTVREAIGKATGAGLAMVMDGVDRLPARPHSGHWLSSDRRWLLAHSEPRSNLSLALAVRAAVPFEAVSRSPVRLRRFSEDEVDACLRLSERALDPGLERQPGASA